MSEEQSTSSTIEERFAKLREAFLPEILALIDEVVRTAVPASATLVEMCRYHLQSGGKRLRALLPLLVAEALGAEPSRIVPFGAACEMLHNATLVHDDLQDGDRLRRGHETVWARYGAPQAINLGDAMFYFTLLLVQRLALPSEQREAAAHRVLCETLRVIDGQEREFKLKQLERPTLSDYFAMVEGKTSGLFALPMAGAAALCAAPAALVAGLQEAARHLGVIFQIQDDVLDLYGEKGRATRGSDIAEGKRSVLVVHALANGSPEQVAWLRGVLDKAREETSAAEITRVSDLLRENGALAFALQEIRRRREQVSAVMRELRHEPLRAMVEGLGELFLAPIQPVLAYFPAT